MRFEEVLLRPQPSIRPCRTLECVSLKAMNDAEVERRIRQAGYDVRWEESAGGGARTVYALRDGKRHTRSHSSLLALAEYLGRVERPVRSSRFTQALDAASKSTRASLSIS